MVRAWPTRSASACDRMSSGMPRELVLYGFDELSPQEQDLLVACRAVGMRVAERGPGGTPGQAIVRVYLRSEDEFADVARRARDILVSDPCRSRRRGRPRPHAISRRRCALFDDVLEPGRVLPGTRADPRPYNVSLGLPLSRYPLVRAALSILRLARGGCPRRRWGRCCAARFSPAASRSSPAGRCSMQSCGPRDGSTSTVELLARRGAGRHHDDPMHVVCCRRGWMPGVRARPKQRARASRLGMEQHFSGAAFRPGLAGERTLDSEDYQTFQKWRELVSGLSMLDPVLGSLRYDDALDWLARLSADTLFQPETEEVPIQVLGVLESAGIEFDHLFVTGLHDEAWPDAARPNPLLPVRAPARTSRAACWRRVGARLCQTHDRRFGSGGARHRCVQLSSRSMAIASCVAARCSPRCQSPRRSCLGPPANRRIEMGMTYAMRAAWIGTAGATHRRHGPPLASGYAVAVVRRCWQTSRPVHFRAFAIHRLGASGLEEGRPGLDPRERGTLLHRTLSQLWGELESQARLLCMSELDLRATVERAVDAAIDWLRRRRPDALSEAFVEPRAQQTQCAALRACWSLRSGAPHFVSCIVKSRESWIWPG